jgi:Tfp pilus assembly protein PilO
MAEPIKNNDQMKDRIAALLPVITVAFAILYGIAGYLLLILPQLSALATGARAEIAGLRESIAADQAYSARLEEQVKDFRMLNTGLKAKIHRVMPIAPETPELFVMFDRIAQRNGLVLESIDTVVDLEAAAEGGVTPVRVSMNVSGGAYRSFSGFLHDIEQNERISDVESLLFVPESGSYAVVLQTYFIETAPPPAADATN